MKVASPLLIEKFLLSSHKCKFHNKFEEGRSNFKEKCLRLFAVQTIFGCHGNDVMHMGTKFNLQLTSLRSEEVIFGEKAICCCSHNYVVFMDTCSCHGNDVICMHTKIHLHTCYR